MADKKPKNIRVKLSKTLEAKGLGFCDKDPLNPRAISKANYDDKGSMEVYATTFVSRQIELKALIPVEEKTEPVVKSIEDMTVKELTAKAEEDKVDLEGCKTKADILAKFAEAAAAAEQK